MGEPSKVRSKPQTKTCGNGAPSSSRRSTSSRANSISVIYLITHTMKRGLAQLCTVSESHLPFDCAQNRFHCGKPDEKLRPKRESEHLSRRPHPQRKRGTPWQEASPCSKKKFSPLGLELNKDKSTIWTSPNGLSHNSNIVERTGMKRADAPIIFHLNSNLDDATNNTATTATLPLDSERPFHNETEKTELNILSGQEDRLHQETRDPH